MKNRSYKMYLNSIDPIAAKIDLQVCLSTPGSIAGQLIEEAWGDDEGYGSDKCLQAVLDFIKEEIVEL